MTRRRPRKGRASRPTFERLEVRSLLAAWSVTGAGPGSLPEIRIFDPSGVEQTHFLASNSSFRGGVQVASGDVNGDGTPDIIAGTGPGGGRFGGIVRVFDGNSGAQFSGPLGDFHPFSPGYRGGVFVATADLNGDGHADVIVGAGPGQLPRIEVFSGADGSVLADFLAFSPSFRGGVRVAAGDFQAGQAGDIVVAAGPGSAPLVKIFQPSTHKVVARYNAFAPSFHGGVFVAAGDLNGDGLADVVVGQGPGGRSRVRAFSGTTTQVLANALAYGRSSSAGVQVGVADENGDGPHTRLVKGMGVIGTGIPNGTTILSVDSAEQITLSAAATAAGSPSITFTPPPGSIFVDSYVSYFGAPFNNFVVNDPDQGINNQALSNVVDVALNPLPFSSVDPDSISLEHEYAASWYAGSQSTQSLPAAQQVGLFWSPLLANPQTNLPASSGQTWTDSNLNESTQFILAPQSSPAPVQPTFSEISLSKTVHRAT